MFRLTHNAVFNVHNHIHVRIPSTPAQNRSRLSLDLGSPTTSVTKSLFKSTTPVSAVTPTSLMSPSVTKVSTPTSPLVANSAPFPSRYTEFKTYSSTFDGLQALESHISNGTSCNNNNNSVISINGHRVSSTQHTSSPENPLMRVSSLPTINPQNQLAGNYFIFCCKVFVRSSPRFNFHKTWAFRIPMMNVLLRDCRPASKRNEHVHVNMKREWNNSLGYSCHFLTSLALSRCTIYVPFVVDKLEHHGVVSRSRFKRHSPFYSSLIRIQHNIPFPHASWESNGVRYLFMYICGRWHSLKEQRKKSWRRAREYEISFHRIK